IVEDSSGKPISGLTSADFTILDQGQPQTVSVFAAAHPPGPRTRYAFPKNVFTNRFDLTGEDPGTVNIVLFDTLNTSAADQIFVRRQVLRFLQNLKATDHVAVYALTTHLIVLHDFTKDSAALVSAVNDFITREQSAFDASHPENVDLTRLTGNPDWLAFQQSLNNVEGMIADQATIDRAGFTAAALEAIAGHVT